MTIKLKRCYRWRFFLGEVPDHSIKRVIMPRKEKRGSSYSWTPIIIEYYDVVDKTMNPLWDIIHGKKFPDSAIMCYFDGTGEEIDELKLNITLQSIDFSDMDYSNSESGIITITCEVHRLERASNSEKFKFAKKKSRRKHN